MRSRDEFPADIKRTLANRAGNVCSNPECRALTSGPQLDPEKSLNVGVAAHITAASEGGPRFNPVLTPVDRSSAENGIWLCQNCAKLVDNDSIRYPDKLLRDWKSAAEHRALNHIGKTISTGVESEVEKKRRLILVHKGERITLRHLNSGRAAILNGRVRGEAEVTLVDCDDFTVTYKSSGDTFVPLPLSAVEPSVDYQKNGRFALEVRP